MINEIFIDRSFQGSLDYLSTFLENPSIFILGFILFSSVALLFKERISTPIFVACSALSFTLFYIEDFVFEEVGADSWEISYRVFLPLFLLYVLRWLYFKKSSPAQTLQALCCLFLIAVSGTGGIIADESLMIKEKKVTDNLVESVTFSYLKDGNYESFIEFCEYNNYQCITSKPEYKTKEKIKNNRKLYDSIKVNIPGAKRLDEFEILRGIELSGTDKDHFVYTWVRNLKTLDYMLIYDNVTANNHKFIESYIYWLFCLAGYSFVALLICCLAVYQGLNISIKEIKRERASKLR